MSRKNMSKKNRKAQRNFILRIPNTEEGDMFYKQLKKYLNTNSYALDRKGSGKRTRDGWENSFNTTMKEADSIRVYLQAKTATGNKQLGVDVKPMYDADDVVVPSSAEAKPRRKFLGFI